MKNKICVNGLCYENKLTFPIHISDHKFESSMDLLLTVDKTKSHYAYIKDFHRFSENKKTKTKNTIAKAVYSVLVVKMYSLNIKKFVWALMVHNL